MGKLPTLLVSAVLSAVFGFVGAAGAMVAFHDVLRGDQGATGLEGAPGETGMRGTDGSAGAVGPPGRAGRAGRIPTPPSYDLGTEGCAGASVEVVTDATVVKRNVRMTKDFVCITAAPGR